MRDFPRGSEGENCSQDGFTNEGKKVNVTLMATATEFDDRDSVLMGEAFGSMSSIKRFIF